MSVYSSESSAILHNAFELRHECLHFYSMWRILRFAEENANLSDSQNDHEEASLKHSTIQSELFCTIPLIIERVSLGLVLHLMSALLLGSLSPAHLSWFLEIARLCCHWGLLLSFRFEARAKESTCPQVIKQPHKKG